MPQSVQVRDGYELWHPNREKAESTTTKTIVAFVLLISAALLVIITLGGWEKLEGAKPVQIAYIVVFLVFAIFVARWSRGVLPMIAALAVILGIFAAVAAPAWFDRDKDGFSDPALSAGVLGLLCFLIVALQVALIITAMVAFRQRWNVEVERPREERGPEPAPAPA